MLEPIKAGERCSIFVAEENINNNNIFVAEGDHSILLEDVLFGDVWFCSGQVLKTWDRNKIRG